MKKLKICKFKTIFFIRKKYVKKYLENMYRRANEECLIFTTYFLKIFYFFYNLLEKI